MNSEGNSSLKNRFPFRLGTTSYIIPADLRANVAFLAEQVDDIELVLFESHEISNLPDAAALQELKEMADRYDLTYTVHLPLDTWLGHAEASVRRRSLDKCLRILERMAVLDPFAYIIHFHGDERGVLPTKDLARWKQGHCRAVERLIQDVSPEALCVETLDYPYEFIEDIVIDYGLGICLDIGHHLNSGLSPEAFLERHLARIRVLHIHGVEAGQDHRSLACLPDGLLTALVNRLGSGPALPRVLTLEIFDEAALNESMDALKRVRQ